MNRRNEEGFRIYFGLLIVVILLAVCVPVIGWATIWWVKEYDGMTFQAIFGWQFCFDALMAIVTFVTLLTFFFVYLFAPIMVRMFP